GDGEAGLSQKGLGAGRQRLGGAVRARVCPDATGRLPQQGNGRLPAFAGPGTEDGRRNAGVPDLEDPQRLREFFELIQEAREAGLLQAYHDRSDGGAFATLCEMPFASQLGLDSNLDGWGEDPFRTLRNEQLGPVV